MHARFRMLETLYNEGLYPTLSCFKAIAEHDATSRDADRLNRHVRRDQLAGYTLLRPQKPAGMSEEDANSKKTRLDDCSV